MVYADISREDQPTCLGYSTGTSPFGPYAYGGVIIDNSGCNPGNWNNHGSICEFRGEWYVFYHRSTHGCKTLRKACAEKISFLPDGSIPEVEMTSQGAGPPMNAKAVTDAARACLLHGSVRIETIADTNEILSGMCRGDAAIFKYLDFGTGIKSFTVCIRSDAGGKLHVFSDKPWHQKLASVETETGTEWEVLTVSAEEIRGIHALWFQATGGDGALFDIDWFRFE
ncbi:MAG: carbohydrate-binding protein [Bacteroidales bacterium]|nr:carbohydrate-binding protein [Bacteroidales bacterium]